MVRLSMLDNRAMVRQLTRRPVDMVARRVSASSAWHMFLQCAHEPVSLSLAACTRVKVRHKFCPQGDVG